MFTNEDEGFQELFDRLLAYSSTKQSVKMSENKRQTRRDDPMDVDALGNKGQNHISNVKCQHGGRSAHYGRDCRET